MFDFNNMYDNGMGLGGFEDGFDVPSGDMGMYDYGNTMSPDFFQGNMGMYRYKAIKATTRNVEEAIAMQLGVDVYNLDFIKLDEPPSIQNWKHSCYQSGVTKMLVNQFIFDDGSNVVYAICPFFPQCNKVHFYVDRGQY